MSLAFPTEAIAAAATLTPSSSAVTPSASSSAQFNVSADAGTLSSNTLTLNNITGSPVDGQQLVGRITNTNSGSTVMVLALGTAYNLFGATLGTIAAGNEAYLRLAYNASTSKWDVLGFNNQNIASIANGGTGQSTQAAAITALTGAQTSGQYLRSNGTNAALAALQTADLTGTLAIGSGGTGNTVGSAYNAGADFTAQSAANSSVASFTTVNAGTYEVGGYVTITAATLDVLNFTVTYTDETSTSRTVTCNAQNVTGTVGIAIGPTTGVYVISPIWIKVAASAAITCKTVLATGGGSIAYDVGATIRQVR
jgi:hypothetical protein